MKLFRRSKQSPKATPTISSVSIAPLADVVSLPPHIRSTIGADDHVVCIANIDAPERQYSLVLDLEWVALAIDVAHQPDDLLDDLPLPRAAMRAVINGWSVTEAFEEPAPRWSEDGIPHVGFPRSEISGLSAIQ